MGWDGDWDWNGLVGYWSIFWIFRSGALTVCELDILTKVDGSGQKIEWDKEM
jgi:hypothetical protein